MTSLRYSVLQMGIISSIEDPEVISGDPFEAHRLGCDQSREIYTCQKGSAEIVISSPGGYPYDCDKTHHFVKTSLIIPVAQKRFVP